MLYNGVASGMPTLRTRCKESTIVATPPGWHGTTGTMGLTRTGMIALFPAPYGGYVNSWTSAGTDIRERLLANV